MKKYLIAAAIALVVFATAAFAASLNVDGSVVQAGTDNSLACATNAVVGWQTQTVFSGEFAVNKITVTFDTGCDGNYAYVAVLKAPGQQTGFGIDLISGDKAEWTVNPSASGALVKDINIVSVAVKNTDDSGSGCWTSGIITACP